VLKVSELERDAITELANIAVGRAAASLRQIVGYEVLLTVPSVDILSREAAAAVIAKPGNRALVAICQDFDGPISGRALLIFPEANSLELVRAIIGQDMPLEDIMDLEDEALLETGNIILNSYVATIANVLKRGLNMSLPSVLRGDGKMLFGGTVVEDSLVLFLYINFEISKKAIKGYLALLMDLPSLEALKVLVNEYLGLAENKQQEHGTGAS
jgi:chemotaxis protein CheC